MPCQLITYDLMSPGKDYTKLHEAIKRLGKWCHCLESMWIVETTSDSATIRNALSANMDTNDKLLVVKLAGNWASRNLSDVCNQWLKENVAN